jgi:hypothetical protein
VTDPHSTTDGDKDEPVRFSVANPPIEEYLEYDPVTDAYFAPGTPSTFDAEAWRREFNNLSEEERRGGLITVDELRAAGALDVPAEWRKSLGEERRYLLPGFEGNDEHAESQSAIQIDSDRDESADELT